MNSIDRMEELEAIEQPLEVIEAGDGGDFGVKEFHELTKLRNEMSERNNAYYR